MIARDVTIQYKKIIKFDMIKYNKGEEIYIFWVCDI